MDAQTVQLTAGDHTQELVGYIFNTLSDDMVDEIAVERDHVHPSGLASEPVLVAATLTLSTTALLVVGRLIEQWLEGQRQEQHTEVVLRAVAVSDEAGRILSDLAEKHASVSIGRGAISPSRAAGLEGSG